MGGIYFVKAQLRRRKHALLVAIATSSDDFVGADLVPELSLMRTNPETGYRITPHTRGW